MEIYKCTSNEFEFLKLQNILQIGKKKTDLLINCKNYFPVRDVTKTGNGERGAGNGERKSGNELSAETSTKIQNGGPKNEREKEEDKERNSCLG